jgi:hypothetical protein
LPFVRLAGLGRIVSTAKTLGTGLRILAVCLLFAVCFAIGGAVAGISRIVQDVPPIEPAPTQLLLPFATFSFCVGIVVSYLILRSSWRGFTLAAVIFVATYGISTIAAQVDTIFFLSAQTPRGLIRALFLQGAIAMAFFAPLAVLILGKWRATSPTIASSAPAPLTAPSLIWRTAFLVVAFVFLYMFFGYYVAWQNPVLRLYYHGAAFSSFYDSIRSNWAKMPLLYLLQVFRALLFVACVFPVIRMLRVARWERSAAVALFLSAWTTVLLLPNPLMPMSVARSHFWETLGFSLIFGSLLGWLLGKTTASAHLARAT